MKSAARTVSIEKIYPLMGMYDDIAVSVKGPLTIGWEVTYPTAYTQNEAEYDNLLNNLAAAIRVLPPYSVVHRQDIYLYDTYKPETNSKDGFLRQSYARHFEGRRYLRHRSFIFITMASKSLVKKPGTGSGFFGFSGKVPVPKQEDLELFRKKCQEFYSIFSSGGAKLRILRKSDWVGSVSTGDTGIIQQYLMLGNRGTVMSDIRTTAENFSVFDKTAIAFSLGESEYLPSEISNISKVDVLSGTSNEVYLSNAAKIGINLDCEHVINQIIVAPAQDVANNELAVKQTRMSGGIASADNRINAEEIQTFLDEAYKNGLFTCYCNTSVVAWGQSDEQLDLMGKVSAALTSMSISASMNKYNTPPLWYAGCPGCAFELGEESLMTMELKSALCLAPFETFDDGLGPQGLLQFCDRSRNIPIHIDTQKLAREQGWIDNFNTFVLGGSGTGKSFTMNTYLRNLYDAEEAAFIIDVGDSYEGLCNIIKEESGGKDGQYFKLDLDHPFSFNPFIGYQSWTNDDGTLRQVEDEVGANFIMSVLQTLWEPASGWTSDTTPILSQMLIEFIVDCKGRNVELPTLDDFFRYVSDVITPKIKYHELSQNEVEERAIIRSIDEWKESHPGKKLTADTKEELIHSVKKQLLDDKSVCDRIIWEDVKKNGYTVGSTQITSDVFDISAFIRAMGPYTDQGNFSFLFNNREPADLTASRFVVFEVDALSQMSDKKFYSLCILCIMNAFESKMRKDKMQFKNLVIEEAWKAIANETMAPYLSSLWKTARKFNTAAIVVTQQISDILSSQVIRDTILQNSSVRILLDQSNNQNNFDELAKLLGLGPREKNLILSINRNNNPLYRYREVFIALGDKKCGVYANEVSREEAVAYESAKDKKNAFLECSKVCNSYVQGVKEIVKLHQSKKL